MDDADRADQEVDYSTQEAVHKRRPAGPVPTGRCLYCDEIVGDQRRWCDIGCREEWERLTRRGA